MTIKAEAKAAARDAVERTRPDALLVIPLLGHLVPLPILFETLEGEGVAVQHICGVVSIVPGSIERHDQAPDGFHNLNSF